MKNEKWKPVVGYDDYEVSDQGRVRSLNYKCTRKVKALKPAISSKGYLFVGLYKNGKKKNFYVHRLVVEAFRGLIPKGKVVNHLNEIKTDNRLENLEVVTAKENVNWGTAQERKAKANSKSMKGNTNRRKELKLTHAKSCAKYTFSNGLEAGKFFGFKNKRQIISYISKARKRGENFINIRDEKHYFHQEA